MKKKLLTVSLLGVILVALASIVMQSVRAYQDYRERADVPKDPAALEEFRAMLARVSTNASHQQ